MAATRDDISKWFNAAKKAGATHMIVACDTFDHGDYPVQVKPGENAREVAQKLRSAPMTSVMEVYSMALDKDTQLAEHRAFHYD